LNQLERRDRVVCVTALELVEHRREVRALDSDDLRDRRRRRHETLGARQLDRARNLFIERLSYVSERHVVSPLANRERGSVTRPKQS
jgi:hypothetical protein